MPKSPATPRPPKSKRVPRPSSQAKSTIRSKTQTRAQPQPAVTPAGQSSQAAAATLPRSLQSTVPAASLSAARAAFKNFSASAVKDPLNAPANFVAPGADTAAIQQQSMTAHLTAISTANRSLRVSLSDADWKTLLPSFKGNTLALGELMTLIGGTMRGTEFYTTGNSTLARLSIQSQIADLMSTIKKGGK